VTDALARLLALPADRARPQRFQEHGRLTGQRSKAVVDTITEQLGLAPAERDPSPDVTRLPRRVASASASGAICSPPPRLVGPSLHGEILLLC
jgi:hypothetical protein